ncbi:TonB-dependent receptor [Chitinophaga sp. sic0106]|uniref:TonB-dependent receptor n=1 Tax=Chitinophaga sp. sic0106 TaxID=2854785 RepID=UPI001C47BF4E|nr:TonB-dependent receptor [Chitinophaga sp. sic0106]MBV7532237.1 TonB-dependent receptor [Chitinophaga sp. sic0106]
MNIHHIYGKRFFFIAAFGLTGLVHQQAFAQKDSLKQETIDIISTYQPRLRDAAKLNLTASLPGVDTARPSLKYEVPSLNLNFMYQAAPLKPLALGKDSLDLLQNNFVKLGYGNLSTPFVQAGFGSGRHEQYNYGLFVNYTGSKGKDIENQDYSTLNTLAAGTYLMDKFQLNGSLAYDRNSLHYYGYDHTTPMEKSDIAQVFNQITATVSGSNLPNNDWAFSIKPKVKFIYFNDNYKRNEGAFMVNLPVRKQIFENIFLQAEGVLDLSNYKQGDNKTINNNIVAVHPAVDIIYPGFVLHAGVNPTWSNTPGVSKFYLLPDIVNETHLIRKKLILSSGWISYIEKNSYRNLTSRNPYFLGSLGDMQNTRIEEKYTGIKGTLGSHFNYNTKFASVTWYNLPLFINDTLDSKRFITLNEAEMRAFQLHAEVGYIQEEKFQARVSFDWFNYNKQETQLKPWALPAFQGNLNVTYLLGKKLHLNADLFSMSGAYYLLSDQTDFGKTAGAWDMNLGASYDITKNFGLWVNANNVFNSHYQRYYLYPSYGFNIVGGLLFKF